MTEEIKIKEEISGKIKRKINESGCSQEIKDFLLKILILEFEHIDEARWRYHDEYESNIKKYVKDWEVD